MILFKTFLEIGLLIDQQGFLPSNRAKYIHANRAKYIHANQALYIYGDANEDANFPHIFNTQERLNHYLNVDHRPVDGPFYVFTYLF